MEKSSEHNKTAMQASPHEMHGHAPKGAADTWLFNIEAVSTLLISTWYLYGVLVTLGILPSDFYDRGSKWVIPFLLGIFYLGAGFLFQQHQCVHSFAQWRTYMKRETIVLLTPFLAFTILVLLTANLAALQPDLVRTGLVSASPAFSFDDLAHAIFIEPVDPVGYFVVLLGFFVIGRTPRTKRGMATLMLLALVTKIAALALTDLHLAGELPYYPMHWLDNWIWFVLGIAMSFFKLPSRLARPSVAITTSAIFAAFGMALYLCGVEDAFAFAVLTLLGLACFYSLSATRFLKGEQNAFFGFVTRYTMAIWLMHEILSRIAFCALFALGFSANGAFVGAWVPVYAIACSMSCYVLPILVMAALSRIWKLGFIVYPSRYLPS